MPSRSAARVGRPQAPASSDQLGFRDSPEATDPALEPRPLDGGLYVVPLGTIARQPEYDTLRQLRHHVLDEPRKAFAPDLAAYRDENERVVR